MNPRGIVLLVVLTAVATGCGRAAAPPTGPPSSPDVSGTWRNPGGQAMRPAQGEVPFTAWGAEQMKAARPTANNDFRETNDPAVLYADPNGYPRITTHPMKFKLVQTEDYIYQLFEYNQNWRQIAMNQSLDPEAAPAWYGYAAGTWEGDTLVVTSRGYRDSSWLDSRGLPHSGELQITERIRREGDMLTIEFTFDDPVAFTQPWSTQWTFVRDQDAPMVETVYTISDELRFRERFLGIPSPIPIRR
jgi:hypothetical protein